MLPNELLAQLEAHQAGKLSETEHKNLQQALAALPEGQQEAAVYARLWTGFAALRAEEQYDFFNETQASWLGSDETELIEWYLAGELSAENTRVLEERKKNDPAFAKQVAEQAQLSTGFTALQADDFRQHLRKWEREEMNTPTKQMEPRPNWSRLVAIAASVLVLIVAGFGWLSHQDYTDEALVERFYQQPPLGNMMGAGEEESAYLETFTAGHTALKSGDFVTASNLLENLSTQMPPVDFTEEDVKYYQDNLDWSIVLAKVGQGAAPEEISTRLERILGEPAHTYHQQAQALQEDLQSVWRW